MEPSQVWLCSRYLKTVLAICWVINDAWLFGEAATSQSSSMASESWLARLQLLSHFICPWRVANEQWLDCERRHSRSHNMLVTVRLRFFRIFTGRHERFSSDTARRVKGLIPGSSDSYLKEQRIYVSLYSSESFWGETLTHKRLQGTRAGLFDRFDITTFADWAAYDDMKLLEKEVGDGRAYFDRGRMVRSRKSPDNPLLEGGQGVGYHAFQLEVFRALHNWCRQWRNVLKEVDNHEQVVVSSYILHSFH